MDNPTSTVYHGDCMDFMAQFPDKYFELAIVDPPYGIGYSKRKNKTVKSSIQYTPKSWDDSKPSIEYFVELEVLKTICLKYDLRFIGLKGFKEFYIERYNLTDIQKKVSFMNSIFVFRKN